MWFHFQFLSESVILSPDFIGKESMQRKVVILHFVQDDKTSNINFSANRFQSFLSRRWRFGLLCRQDAGVTNSGRMPEPP